MSLHTTLIILINSVILLIVILTIKKNKKKGSTLPLENNPLDEQTPPEIQIPSEMPIKPIPVNCQKASFKPAPDNFSYYDCCGELKKGIGFELWEKRAPVSIDANKEFVNMELIGEEGNQDC